MSVSVSTNVSVFEREKTHSDVRVHVYIVNSVRS